MRSAHSRFVVPCFTIFMVMTSAGVSSAHDVWLTFSGTSSARQAVINYGHPGDRPPALADKVIDISLVSDDGNRTSLQKGLAFAVVRGAPVAISRPFSDNGRQLVAATYDNGLWVKAADGEYRNAMRAAVPGATEAFWSRKFAKAITGAGAPFGSVLEHVIEIVPLTDPVAARPDAPLRVRVLLEGKPLPKAKLESIRNGHEAFEFETDSDGIATVSIPGGGDYTLSVGHRRSPSSAPTSADADLLSATYSFGVPRTTIRDWLALLGL